MASTVPTSIRLKPTEIDELRDAAAFSNLTISDVARRAIVAYLGVNAPDIRREDQAATVVELGRIRGDLARLGNLLKLAATTGRPAMPETEHALQDALHDLRIAVCTLIGSAVP